MTQENSTVQFIENHIPALQAGKYHLEISQTLQINNQLKETYKQSKTFYVASERFTLPLQSVHSVFPPESSTGDYGTALPHLVLNRSTLPWERNAGSDRTVPWLALLLFHEDDKLEEAEKFDLKAARTDSQLKFNNRFPSEPQEQDDKIAIIKIPDNLLADIIPTSDELKFLAHVRHVSYSRGSELEETELAVVIGNRLPLPGRNIVHLVSLENYFSSQSSPPSPYFVSLKSWEFQCKAESSQYRFRDLLTGLKSHSLEGNTLRRPKQGGNEDAEKYLSQGYVPLPHHLRNSQNTISWYRGPLLSGQNSTSLRSAIFPVRTADRLLRYLTDIDMFDVSYAAAYQLGQLLALQDKTFSINLYNWKRQQARSQQNSTSDRLAVVFDHSTDSNSESDVVPEKVKAWFEEIALLKNLPFNYLVPEPLMLPEESIRFFWADNQWLKCLSEGAFGMGENGTSNEADKQRLLVNKENALDKIFQRVVTGFLLRSAVVSEFPALNVKGFGQKSEQQLKVLRKDNLSDTVLMYLFEGEVQSVEISLGAEILHFGLERSKETFMKAIRYQGQKEKKEIYLNDTSWKNKDKIIINIANFSKQLLLTEPNASSFALAMVESSPQVVFSLIC